MAYDHHQILDKLDEILRSNPRLHLSDLAHTLRIDRHTIEKAVSRSTGMSFRQYRDKKVLECSFRHLKYEVGLNEKAIAYKIGFGSTAAFCHFIKRSTGRTPTQLRGVLPSPPGSGQNTPQKSNILPNDQQFPLASSEALIKNNAKKISDIGEQVEPLDRQKAAHLSQSVTETDL